MKKLISLAAGVAMLALATGANAAQPVALTDSQMDGVTAGGGGGGARGGPARAPRPVALTDSQMDGGTAGGLAVANAGSLALGEVTADTLSITSTNVDTV